MVNKIGDVVILLPKQNKWYSFIKAVDMFSDDFRPGAEQEIKYRSMKR